MFFLNFGLAQLLIIAGAASFVTVALYLLDRSRRRQVVSTLRFWTAARAPVQTSRRKHIQQPWSLLLQVLGILLLLLAIAQPRIGNPFGKPGYDVLVLETSAWMGATDGRSTLMDGARARALQWLASVPANDRVMLVRADALATPATAFEADRHRIEAAIAASEPGATSLDIVEALSFARRAQALQSGRGEIAFVGSGRVKERKEAAVMDSSDLRVMLVPDAIENAGLRRMSARRSATDPSEWDAIVAVRNYGPKPRLIGLGVAFDHAPVGSKRILLAPGAEQETAVAWHSRQAGLLEAQISPADGFSDDDHAALMIPALPALRVVVYTQRPEILRPFFAANPRVDAQFRLPAQYQPDAKALVILDRFAPPARPQGDSIWIDPPASQSPLTVIKTVPDARGLRWITSNPLGEGLRAHDAKLGTASVFRAGPADVRVAEIEDGPAIVARPGAVKTVVIGFDPGAPGTRFQLSTPLAFANILRWIDPETFRQSDFSVQAAGTVSTPLETAQPIQVTRANGAQVPFTVDHGALRFFSGDRENVRVADGDRESVYSLTLPEMWDVKWRPPAGALHGIPRSRGIAARQPEIWPWLAVLGGACLLAEWTLFARVRRARLKAMPARPSLRRAS
jgi:hypothetical protein